MSRPSALERLATADSRDGFAAWARVRLGVLERASAGHLGLTLALGILFVVLSVASPYFLTTQNLLSTLREISFVGLIAFGMTFVIVAGEIDLSVGSVIGFSSALLGVLAIELGWPIWLAVAAVVMISTTTGLAAGAVRSYLNVPSFIATLALFTSLRGLAYLMTNAYPVLLPDEGFANWGDGDIYGVPIPTVLLAIVFFACWAAASRTTFGRSVYAVGGNAEAAHLSGIPVTTVRVVLFGLTGCLAAVAGVLQSARLASANASIGIGAEFAVISAVIVGGTSLSGGRGTMVGTLLGVLFIGFLSNGLVLLGVNSYGQAAASGAIVLLAVLAGGMRGSQRRRPHVVVPGLRT